jgi:predicted transglutaminase-like cysteine proteinase
LALKFWLRGVLTGVLLLAPALTTAVALDEQQLQLIAERYGHSAYVRVLDWQQLMERLLAQSEQRRLEDTNDFFNRVEWVSDLAHWGQEDYWATPVETLVTNGGDCEDFSIGKFFSLIRSGVIADKLRITYVKAIDYNQAHMVLAYYPTPDAEPLILDNINKTILPASQRPDLLPIYSFNAEGLWLAKARSARLAVKSQDSLPQWRGVNERMLNGRVLPP